MSEPQTDSATGSAVAARLAALRERMRSAGRDPASVRVVAVTKGLGEPAARAALDAGLHDLGENYVQPLVRLASLPWPEPVRWHLIGPPQRNKVRHVAPHVYLWQAVDRPEAGDEIARRAPGARVLVQVNLSGHDGKAGCSWAAAPDLVEQCVVAGLSVDGLMGVGPAGPPELARPGFRRLAEMAAALGLRELSMGMSADLDVALEEGTTIVRLGRALFGPRPATAGVRR